MRASVVPSTDNTPDAVPVPHSLGRADDQGLPGRSRFFLTKGRSPPAPGFRNSLALASGFARDSDFGLKSVFALKSDLALKSVFGLKSAFGLKSDLALKSGFAW